MLFTEMKRSPWASDAESPAAGAARLVGVRLSLAEDADRESIRLIGTNWGA